MKILVGLGNPGLKYKNNRHNVGFMVVDKIAQIKNSTFRRAFGISGHIAKLKVDKKDVILIKPATFMNNSGICVKKVIAKYCIHADNLFIIYDDADLPLGVIRAKKSGSSGGHQGMESIIETLASSNISRLKIGIGKSQGMDLADYVLSDFFRGERTEIDESISKAASACMEWINSGTDYVMAKYNKGIKKC